MERKKGTIKPKSYPTYIGINISTLCNQVCLFCCHENKRIKHKNWLDAELFQKMKWLRNVERIDLFCGTGDPLVNPYFPEVLRTVRKVAPDSTIGIFTNGLALDGDNLTACLECLDILHISLNAVTKNIYESIIIGDYARAMRNMKELSKRKPSKLKVELSLVLLRKNVADVKPLINLASDYGFETVILCHFAVMTDRPDRFGKDQSIMKDMHQLLSLKELESYAKQKNVEFYFPQTNQPVAECYQPWTHAYLNNDWEGKTTFQVCCSGFPMHLYIDESSFIDFRKVWNSKRMQYVRKTVNVEAQSQNNMCFLCRQVDKLEPNWKENAKQLAITHKRDLTFNKADFPEAFQPIRIE